MSKTKEKKQRKMLRKNHISENSQSDNSPRVFQNNKINFELNILERNDLTDKQKQLIELIEDKNTRVVFIQGPAGTSKSFSAIYAGLKLMNKKTISDIIYVRSIIESASKSLGSLPGEADDKMEPFLMPLREKLEELLPKSQLDQLIKEDRIQGIPVNFLRGASINAKFVIVDESQNLNAKETVTALTRIGKFSKFIFLGDPLQSDIGTNSGFMKFFDMFNDEESRRQGIHCFSFTKEDIVRSGILRYIVDKIEGTYTPPTKRTDDPMFPDNPEKKLLHG